MFSRVATPQNGAIQLISVRLYLILYENRKLTVCDPYFSQEFVRDSPLYERPWRCMVGDLKVNENQNQTPACMNGFSFEIAFGLPTLK